MIDHEATKTDVESRVCALQRNVLVVMCKYEQSSQYLLPVFVHRQNKYFFSFRIYSFNVVFFCFMVFFDVCFNKVLYALLRRHYVYYSARA